MLFRLCRWRTKISLFFSFAGFGGFFPRPKLSIGETVCRLDFSELSTDAKSQTTHLHFELKYLFPCMIRFGSDFFDIHRLYSAHFFFSRPIDRGVCGLFSLVLCTEFFACRMWLFVVRFLLSTVSQGEIRASMSPRGEDLSRRRWLLPNGKMCSC